MKRFTLYQIKRDITRTFLVSLLLSLCVFGWLRLMFFDFPFSFLDEAGSLVKTVATYWALLLGVKMLLNVGLVIFDRVRKPVPLSAALSATHTAAIMLLFLSALA